MINVQNRTVFYRDNIHILRGLNSTSVDLIYLDPPFNKNDTFVNSDNRRVKEIKDFFLKKQTSGEFKDVNFDEVFKDDSAAFSDIWNKNDLNQEYYRQIDLYDDRLVAYIESVRDSAPAGGFYYLIYMAVRLIEMKRILKDNGSLYLHCDPVFSHYLKAVLDFIFGEENFRNEIIWSYPASPSSAKRDFARKHDVIFRYVKSSKFVFNTDDIRVAYSLASLERIKYQARASTVMSGSVIKLQKAGKVPTTVWADIQQAYRYRSEATGYPTQKPLALLERIIKASSNRGDIVLDPFCGCATTCLAAEKLDRQWLGIDKNPQTYYMIYYRAYRSGLLGVKDKPSLTGSNLIQTSRIPKRSDLSEQEKKVWRKTQEDLKLAARLKVQKDKKVKFSSYEREIIKADLYGAQAGICAGCDVYMQSANLTLDHIIPKSYGGDDRLDNLQLLCHRDNIFKSNKPMTELFQKLLVDKLISQATHDKQMKHWQLYKGKDDPQSQRYAIFCRDYDTQKLPLTDS